MATFSLKDFGPAAEEMWAEELKRQIEALDRFYARYPPSPPPPRWKRIWYRVRNALVAVRERVGELVAGRKFD